MLYIQQSFLRIIKMSLMDLACHPCPSCCPDRQSISLFDRTSALTAPDFLNLHVCRLLRQAANFCAMPEIASHLLSTVLQSAGGIAHSVTQPRLPRRPEPASELARIVEMDICRHTSWKKSLKARYDLLQGQFWSDSRRSANSAD